MLPPWLRGVAMEGLMGCVVTGDGVTCVRDATTTSSPSAATMSLQGQSHKHTTQVSDKPSSGRVMSGAYRAESATVIPSNRGRAICRVTSLPRFVSSGTTPDPTISVLNLPVQPTRQQVDASKHPHHVSRHASPHTAASNGGAPMGKDATAFKMRMTCRTSEWGDRGLRNTTTHAGSTPAYTMLRPPQHNQGASEVQSSHAHTHATMAAQRTVARSACSRRQGWRAPEPRGSAHDDVCARPTAARGC